MIEAQGNHEISSVISTTEWQSAPNSVSSQGAYHLQLTQLYGSLRDSLYIRFDPIKDALMGSAFSVISLTGLGKSRCQHESLICTDRERMPAGQEEVKTGVFNTSSSSFSAPAPQSQLEETLCLQLSHIEKTAAAQFKFGIQNWASAKNTETAIMLANLIIEEKDRKGNGKINIDIAMEAALYLEAYYTAQNPKYLSIHQQNVIATLKHLGSEAQLVSIINAIGENKIAPETGEIIRATLNLGPHIEVNELHARRAALSAILGEARQMKAGSCFSTLVNIYVHDHFRTAFASNLQSLISTDKIHVPKEGTIVGIPVSRYANHHTADRKFTVTVDGDVIRNGKKIGQLHENPGMQAVLRALGIADGEMETTVAGVIGRLCGSMDKTIDICARDVAKRVAMDFCGIEELHLEAAAKLKKLDFQLKELKNWGSSAEYLAKTAVRAETRSIISDKQDALARFEKAMKRALDAFVAKEQVLLLVTVDNTAATLATSSRSNPQHGPLKDAMLNGKPLVDKPYLKSLKDKLDDIGKGMSPQMEKAVVNSLKGILLDKFSELVENKLHYRFRPDVSTTDASEIGGFLLYQGSALSDDKECRAVETVDDFKEVVSDLIEEAARELTKSGKQLMISTSLFGSSREAADKELEAISSMAKDLAIYASQDSFAEFAIVQCGDRKMSQVSDVVRDAGFLEVTPWKRHDGAYSADILSGYLGLTQEVQHVSKSCQDVEGILHFVIETLKKNGLTQRPVLTAAGWHAFSLLPDKLTEAISTDDVDAWINHTLVEPGKKLEQAYCVEDAENEDLLKSVTDYIVDVMKVAIAKNDFRRRVLEAAVSYDKAEARGAIQKAVGDNEEKMRLFDDYLTQSGSICASTKDKEASASSTLKSEAVPDHLLSHADLAEAAKRLNLDETAFDNQVLRSLPRYYRPGKFHEAIEANLEPEARKLALGVTDSRLFRKLMPPIMPFADSNYTDPETGMRRQYAVAYNIGKGALELWNMTEDGSRVELIINQNRWTGTPWKIITDPKAVNWSGHGKA